MIEKNFFDRFRRSDKTVESVLGSIHGIGRVRSENLCFCMGFDRGKRFRELNRWDCRRIVELINHRFLVETDLRLHNHLMLKSLKDKGILRGVRLAQGLPANGQRTHTNARTAKRRNKQVG